MELYRKSAFLMLVIAAIVAGCTNHDKRDKEINYDDLYFDYTVSAEEGNENVTCVLQFKKGGDEGKAINIEPSKIELDGEPIETDSAKLSGFFYEVQKPLNSFVGKHTIVFRTADNRQYKNDFEFSAFSFNEELPGKVRRKPFTIHLKNFPTNVKAVRLLLLDTAFESPGFNDLVPVVNKQINIDQYVLSSVRKGPVVLELYLEQERQLKQHTPAGGKISITYGLKKEFDLTD
jgi:hypothetical protein